MNDLHEITFQWPHPEPNHVIVTGTFDQWSSSITLSREGNGFKATTTIPWDEKISYKYIVDGNWTTASDQPTETDNAGNVNNVYTSPSKPPPPVVEAPPPVLETVELAKVEEAPELSANGHAASTGGKPDDTVGGVTIPQVITDVLSTVAATEGTTSAFGYVASGVGAAIQAVVGVDPINGEKVSAEEPTSKEEPTLAPASEPEAAPASLPAAPAVGTIVPITIVPVNASENNHAATNETLPGSESPSTHEPAKPVTGSSSVPELPSPLELPPTNGTAAPILKAAVIEVSEASPPTATEPVPPVLPESQVEEVQALPAEVIPTVADVPVTQPEEPKEVLAAAPAITQVDKPAVHPIETAPITPQASTTLPAPIETETKSVDAEPAATNGTKEEARPATPTPITEAKPTESSPGPSAPTTPVKSSISHIFPSSGSPDSAKTSPSGTTASRKKRQSIFGKIHLKNIFSSDKKEKDEKTKKGKP